jgi:hypothetical protein
VLAYFRLSFLFLSSAPTILTHRPFCSTSISSAMSSSTPMTIAARLQLHAETGGRRAGDDQGLSSPSAANNQFSPTSASPSPPPTGSLAGQKRRSDQESALAADRIAQKLKLPNKDTSSLTSYSKVWVILYFSISFRMRVR